MQRGDTMMNQGRRARFVGTRTHEDVVAGKIIRQDAQGFDNFSDYFTDSDDDESDISVPLSSANSSANTNDRRISSPPVKPRSVLPRGRVGERREPRSPEFAVPQSTRPLSRTLITAGTDMTGSFTEEIENSTEKVGRYRTKRRITYSEAELERRRLRQLGNPDISLASTLSEVSIVVEDRKNGSLVDHNENAVLVAVPEPRPTTTAVCNGHVTDDLHFNSTETSAVIAEEGVELNQQEARVRNDTFDVKNDTGAGPTEELDSTKELESVKQVKNSTFEIDKSSVIDTDKNKTDVIGTSTKSSKKKKNARKSDVEKTKDIPLPETESIIKNSDLEITVKTVEIVEAEKNAERQNGTVDVANEPAQDKVIDVVASGKRTRSKQRSKSVSTQEEKPKKSTRSTSVSSKAMGSTQVVNGDTQSIKPSVEETHSVVVGSDQVDKSVHSESPLDQTVTKVTGEGRGDGGDASTMSSLTSVETAFADAMAKTAHIGQQEKLPKSGIVKPKPKVAPIGNLEGPGPEFDIQSSPLVHMCAAEMVKQRRAVAQRKSLFGAQSEAVSQSPSSVEHKLKETTNQNTETIAKRTSYVLKDLSVTIHRLPEYIDSRISLTEQSDFDDFIVVTEQQDSDDKNRRQSRAPKRKSHSTGRKSSGSQSQSEDSDSQTRKSISRKSNVRKSQSFLETGDTETKSVRKSTLSQSQSEDSDSQTRKSISRKSYVRKSQSFLETGDTETKSIRKSSLSQSQSEDSDSQTRKSISRKSNVRKSPSFQKTVDTETKSVASRKSRSLSRHSIVNASLVPMSSPPVVSSDEEKKKKCRLLKRDRSRSQEMELNLNLSASSQVSVHPLETEVQKESTKVSKAKGKSKKHLEKEARLLRLKPSVTAVGSESEDAFMSLDFSKRKSMLSVMSKTDSESSETESKKKATKKIPLLVKNKRGSKVSTTSEDDSDSGRRPRLRKPKQSIGIADDDQIERTEAVIADDMFVNGESSLNPGSSVGDKKRDTRTKNKKMSKVSEKSAAVEKVGQADSNVSKRNEARSRPSTGTYRESEVESGEVEGPRRYARRSKSEKPKPKSKLSMRKRIRELLIKRKASMEARRVKNLVPDTEAMENSAANGFDIEDPIIQPARDEALNGQVKRGRKNSGKTKATKKADTNDVLVDKLPKRTLRRSTTADSPTEPPVETHDESTEAVEQEPSNARQTRRKSQQKHVQHLNTETETVESDFPEIPMEEVVLAIENEEVSTIVESSQDELVVKEGAKKPKKSRKQKGNSTNQESMVDDVFVAPANSNAFQLPTPKRKSEISQVSKKRLLLSHSILDTSNSGGEDSTHYDKDPSPPVSLVRRRKPQRNKKSVLSESSSVELEESVIQVLKKKKKALRISDGSSVGTPVNTVTPPRNLKSGPSDRKRRRRSMTSGAESVSPPKRRKSVTYSETLVHGPQSTGTPGRSILKRKSITPATSPASVTFGAETPGTDVSTLGVGTPGPVHYYRVDEEKARTPYMPKKKGPNKIIRPRSTPSGLRRSRRTRVLPLAWYKNERIEYTKRKSGGFLISNVLPPPVDEVPTKKKKSKKTVMGRKHKRLSTHAHLSHSVVFAENDGEIPVIYPEIGEEVLLDCVATADQLVFSGVGNRQPTEHDQILIAKPIQQPAFSCGSLIIRGLQEKQRQFVNHDTLIFNIMQGKVAVTIHKTSTIMEEGGMFFVPRGNCYSIKNLRRDDAKLTFTQLKNAIEGQSGSEVDEEGR